MLPAIDHVTVGGTRQYNSNVDDIDDYDSAAIWNRAVEMMPSMAKAEVICQSVAWRPNRTEVRVEKEVTKGGLKVLIVI